MVEKTCMNCGTSGCDHKDARRCSNGHSLWTPRLSEIEQLRQRVQELTAERDKVTQYWQIAEGRCDALMKQRDELVAALINHQEQTRPIQQTIDAIASVKEK